MLAAGGGPQVLEVNAIPGLTDTSLFPMAAEAAGMSFEDMVGRIVESALARPRRASAALPGLSRSARARSQPDRDVRGSG